MRKHFKWQLGATFIETERRTRDWNILTWTTSLASNQRTSRHSFQEHLTVHTEFYINDRDLNKCWDQNLSLGNSCRLIKAVVSLCWLKPMILVNILLACDSPPSSSPAAHPPPLVKLIPTFSGEPECLLQGNRLQAWWNHPCYNNIIAKHSVVL